MNKSNIKHIFHYFTFSLGSMFIGIVSTVYLSKILVPEEFGQIGIFQSILAISVMIISFSSTGLVNINQTNKSDTVYLKYRRAYFILCFILFVSLLSLTFIFSPTLLYILAIIYGYFKVLNSIHSLELIFHYKSKTQGILLLSTNLILFSLTILFISYFEMNYWGRIWSFLTSEIIMFLIRFYIFNTYKTPINYISTEEIIKIVKYGFPLMIGSGAGWILYQSDKFIISYYYDLALVGVYTISASYAAFLIIVNQSILNAMKPEIYRNLKNKFDNEAFSKIHIINLIMLVVFILFIISFYYLFEHLTNSAYHEKVDLMLIVISSTYLVVLATNYGLILEYFQKNFLRTRIYYVSAFIYLLTVFILGEFFKSEYMFAIATFFSHTVLIILNNYYARGVLER